MQRENKWQEIKENTPYEVKISLSIKEIETIIQEQVDTAIAERDKEINEIIDNTLGNDWSDMNTMYLTIQRIINLITKEQ